MSEKYHSRGEVLITGASGFFGGTALEKMRKMGERVVGTTRDIETKQAERLDLNRLDPTNIEETKKFIRDRLPQTIFHFFGMSRPRLVEDNPGQAKLANVDSVMNLVNAILCARDKNPRYDPVVVVAGTVEQIGDADNSNDVLNEESKRTPPNLYAIQKEEMSLVFLNFCNSYNIRGYVALQGQATGVSSSGEISQNKGFLIPDMASQIAQLEVSGLAKGTIETGIISHKRNIININDAIDAYLKLARNKPVVGEYLVCADNSVALDYILEIMIDNSSIEITHKIDQSRGFGTAKNRFYSHNKITKATGWRPTTQIEKTAVDVLNFQRKILELTKV